MRWDTHVLFGVNSIWLFSLIPLDVTSHSIGALAACASLGALLPDLDAAESKIKYVRVAGASPFMLPSRAAHQLFGHRGVLHSLLAVGVLAVVVVPSVLWLGWDWELGAALVLGYSSHLMADACTKSGIPLLYPRQKRYALLPKPWRLTTGSEAEGVLMALLLLPALVLLLGHGPLGG
jgi:inner membrane protein